LLSPKVRTPTSGLTGGLYANLMSNMKAEDSDIWSQYEMAKKEMEVEDWKKADSTQKPVQEMDIEQKKPNTAYSDFKRKLEFENELDTYDHDTLFYQYWSRNKKVAMEFDGRLE
jgi:hypothetical protein